MEDSYTFYVCTLYYKYVLKYIAITALSIGYSNGTLYTVEPAISITFIMITRL